jgi:P-type Mg2+ transporter
MIFNALTFALSVAVGLAPEMLPVIVTANLAKGAIAMSDKKVIVKNIDAIQDFGLMNILCTDKTGTLTQDKIVLAPHPIYTQIDVGMRKRAKVQFCCLLANFT